MWRLAPFDCSSWYEHGHLPSFRLAVNVSHLIRVFPSAGWSTLHTLSR